MACPQCRRRAALVAAIAPAISRLSLGQQSLLSLLALPDAQLLRAAKVEDPRELLRGLQIPAPTENVPTGLCRHDPSYPEALRQLPSAPAVLYATCTIERLRELLSKPTVAILGGREYTSYAQEMTFALANELAAAGVTLISGMNTGLEGILHRVAVEARGHPIAVMPGSADVPFPGDNKSLHRGILAHGAAVSEIGPGFFPPPGWCFVASQRTIAALSNLVVIVEAGRRSCAALTTQIATDLGREVAVVPGRVTDPGGKWLFALLRDGAHPSPAPRTCST